jgi:hypothetical protein
VYNPNLLGNMANCLRLLPITTKDFLMIITYGIYDAGNDICQSISFASSPSGSGKTRELVRRGVELARNDQRVIIAQPTKALIDRTVANELLPICGKIPYKVFNEDSVARGTSVAREIVDYLNNAEPVGQIIFITHQVLAYLPHIANKSDWHVLVDEDPQVLRHYSHHVPETHSIITDLIRLLPDNNGYSRVLPRNQQILKAKGRNKNHDEILSKFAETLRILNSPNYKTYVNADQHSRLLAGQVLTLDFHSVLNPGLFAGFASVFVTAANLEDSLIYQLWKPRVAFLQDSEFSNGLRFKQHDNGSLITIYFGIDRPWSKKIATHDLNGSQNVRHWFIEAGKLLFGAEPFLWQANKSVDTDPFEGCNATRLPNAPHGRNDYADFDNLIFLSALNPQTSHFKFLEAQGLSSQEVKTAIYHATAYQAVMRTSIRDPNNQQRKHIIVPDQPVAAYLQSKFPGSRLERLTEEAIIKAKKNGRPRKYKSHAEQQAAYRQRTKEQMLYFAPELSVSLECDETPIE